MRTPIFSSWEYRGLIYQLKIVILIIIAKEPFPFIVHPESNFSTSLKNIFRSVSPLSFNLKLFRLFVPNCPKILKTNQNIVGCFIMIIFLPGLSLRFKRVIVLKGMELNDWWVPILHYFSLFLSKQSLCM